jgi:hypothetical protein
VTFPTTAILDTFTRANVGPPPSSSWTTDVRGFGDAGMKVSSNTVISNAVADAPASTWWNVGTFGPSSESYMTLSTLITSGQKAGPMVRISGPGTANADGYAIHWVYASGGTDGIEIMRMDNGVFTQLGATISQDLAVGDSLGLEAIGSAITAYRKPSAGAWGSLGSRADATYSAAGFAGIYQESTAGAWVNFGGGTVVASFIPFQRVNTLVRM